MQTPDGGQAMSREQIEQAFIVTVGIEPREADYQVLEVLGPDVESVAEYIWDHWLGEPDAPTIEQVEACVRMVT